MDNKKKSIILISFTLSLRNITKDYKENEIKPKDST